MNFLFLGGLDRVRYAHLVRWCKGSTDGFGPSSRGSNPCRTTIGFTIHFVGLILAKEEFQIVLGKALGKALFTEHIGNGLLLTLLQVPDFFFNRSGCN